MADELKGVPVAPLTGVLDARSPSNLMPQGSLRMRQNFQTVGDGKLRRGTGFRKLLSSSTYNNADLHDQLLALSTDTRKPITLLYQAENSHKTRALIAANQSTVFKLNSYSENWAVLGYGYGGTQNTNAGAPRFKAAVQGDYLILTNDVESPRYHELGGALSLSTFSDLAVIGLTRAALVWTWRNVTFFADFEMDGERFSNGIIWGDYDNPLSWDPAKVESIAGTRFLDSGERILAGMPSGNSFLIYTNRAIWEMVVVGGDMSFDVVRRYNGEENKGAGVLKFPNTLTALPDGHLYCAEDGIYVYNQNFSEPERVEWLHRASNLIYDSIDTSNCTVHVAVAHQNEILISTAPTGATGQRPTRTLRLNWKYKTADYVDTGFTALCSFQHTAIPSLRDWILANGICDLAGLESRSYGYGANEGLPRTIPSFVGTAPDCFYTQDTQTVHGFTVEDWTKGSADATSLCAALAGARLDDTCRTCEPSTLLVGAWSTDLCLKELGTVFYREECANPTSVGSSGAHGYTSSVGSYILGGFDSILRFAPSWADVDGDPLVQADNFKLNIAPVAQSPPSTIGLRVGISANPEDDANDTGANIVWHQRSLKNLESQTDRTPAQHAAANSMPVDLFDWNFLHKGRALHFELKITGTGGDAVLSKARVLLMPEDAEY